MRTAFIVTIKGDPSVGIFSDIAKVTIEDSYEWDHDRVMGAKEAISDFFEVPIACVHEEAEYATKRLAEEQREANQETLPEDKNT